MPLEAHLMIVLLTGAIVGAMVLVMIRQSRAAVAAAIRGAGATAGSGSPRAQFADTWHVFAILYVVAIWLLWAMSMLAQGPSTIWAAIASVGVLLLFPMLDRAIGRILDELSGTGHGAAPRSTYHGVLRRGARVIVAGVLGFVVLQLWGFNLMGEAGAAAQQAAIDASLDIAVAVLLAYLGWQLVKVGIDRRLTAREVNGVVVEPSPRMRTLLPLARKFVVTVLAVMTVMLVLSAAGVNIGPLLAGAGVVGIAIGFGAQSLVRDVMSGIFFLVEDAFRVGEYIEMGELRGEVEAISLRSLRLRHHRGAIHTIPYGELRSITNYNRDWVIYKMPFRVAFDTDIDKVKKLVKKIGQELAADPELGEKLIEPLKSQGVTEIDDLGMIIRVKFMCKPREQFILRREAYKRIKAAFDANGIEFARRKVEVHAPRDAADGEAAAATAAAEPASATA
jgi:small-conductance mechanosensitive channel